MERENRFTPARLHTRTRARYNERERTKEDARSTPPPLFGLDRARRNDRGPHPRAHAAEKSWAGKSGETPPGIRGTSERAHGPRARIAHGKRGRAAADQRQPRPEPFTLEAQHMTPIKAIRAYCISCCRENRAEVRACPAAACPLHPYRMGHRPKPGAEDPEENVNEEMCPDRTPKEKAGGE